MKKLTFQQYISLFQDSISLFFKHFLPVFTNVLAAVIAIVIGVVLGWILKRIVQEASKAVNLERTLSTIPAYSDVVKSHEESDITNFIGEILRWIAILVFLIPAFASLQIAGAGVVFILVFGFISKVLLASLFLLLGFVVAWFLHRVVMAVGTVVGNNPAHLIANLAYLAVVIFALVQGVFVLGVSAVILRLFVMAVFVALLLAFGLAGREVAADWLKKFAGKVNK